MNNSLPFSSTTVVYTPGTTPGSRHIAARGAGKWALALQEAGKTLQEGDTVWVKASEPELQRQLVSQLNKAETKRTGAAGSGYKNNWTASRIPPPAFGDYSFAATVGLWFKGAGTDAAALLSPFISTEGFSFTPKEFIDLRERLYTAIRRYERLPDVSRGLEDLNTGFFRHRTLDESREFITDRLNIYLLKGAALHRDFLMVINRYTRQSIFSESAQLQACRKEISSLLQDHHSLAGKSGKAGKKARRKLAERWQLYRQEHKVAVPSEDPWEAQLKQELAALEQRQSQLFRDLQSAGLALNALTADSRFVEPQQLSSLENRLTDLIREVDEAGLYQLPLGRTEAATTHRQFLRLEGLLEKLRNTERHLPELPDFYGRRHFWYAQPAHLRRLLAPLLNLPTSDWETAFSSWYFDRCLEKWVKDNPPPLLPLKPAAVPPEQNRAVAGRVKPFPATSGHPVGISEKDLFIDLDGDIAPPPALPCRSVRLAPLHDETADLFAIAGVRNPVLLFSQNFFPLSPPPWRARASSIAPPGFPAGTILCQAKDDTKWVPLTDWALRTTTTLHLFLPLSPTSADAKCLLQRWEYLIATNEEITFFHSWTADDITQALLSDGYTAVFLSAALLRAAEAAEFEPFDRQALVAIGQEIQLRCGLHPPVPHPLAENFAEKLKSHLPDHFFETHQPWRDTFLPLVLLSPSGKKSVLLPDGKLPGHGTQRTEKNRLRELSKAGFQVLPLSAHDIWADPAGELIRIAGAILDIG